MGKQVSSVSSLVAIPKIYAVGVAFRPAHSRVVWYNLAQTEQIVSVKKPRAKGKTY